MCCGCENVTQREGVWAAEVAVEVKDTYFFGLCQRSPYANRRSLDRFFSWAAACADMVSGKPAKPAGCGSTLFHTLLSVFQYQDTFKASLT